MRDSFWRKGVQRILGLEAGGPGGSLARRRRAFEPRAEELERRLTPANPSVLSINRANPAAPNTSAASVEYTVTFSAAVTGVDPSDFAVLKTGTVAAGAVQVTPVSASSYTVTIGGVAGQGSLGLNLVDDGSIRDAANNPLLKPNAPVTFAAPKVLATDHFPTAVVLTDINGDGKKDLITANLVGTANLFLGQGDGAFQPPKLIDAGNSAFAMATGDVDGDNQRDLAFSGIFGDAVKVLLGNGNGTFQKPQVVANGSLAYSITLGDINGDGKPDLAVAISDAAGPAVKVMLANGDGTFQAPQALKTDSRPLSLALGDLNADGKPDFAVANAGVNTVTVLLGNGNGTFQAPLNVVGGYSQHSVTMGDVNGDGKPDLAVTNTDYYSPTVTVLLGNGNGTFRPPATYATGFDPYTVAFADINGDGKTDLVVPNAASNNVGVLLGNGDGLFQRQQTFATDVGPDSVVVDDINGDGRPDVAASNLLSGTVNVLLNTGNGNFAGQTYLVDHVLPAVQAIERATPAGPATSANNVTYTVTFGAAASGVNAGDFAVVTTGSAWSSQTQVAGSGSVYTVTVSGIKGEGALSLERADNSITGPAFTIDHVAPLVQTIDRAASPGPGANSVAFTVTFSEAVAGVDAADFAVVATGTAASAGMDVSGSGSVYTVVVNGVTGVGRLGLKTVNNGSVHDMAGNLLSNVDATAAFQNQKLFGVGQFPRSVKMADVNKDGKLDIVTANSFSDGVSVFLGNGDGTFQAQKTFATDSGARDVIVGDLNSDGNPDLAVVNPYGNDVSILLGNGNGAFQAQQTFATGAYPTSVMVGDVNGDGKPDLAVANGDDDSVSVLLGNGDGSFQRQMTFDGGSYPFAAVMGDVNGDGKPDLAVANPGLFGSSLSVLLGNGDGSFQEQQTFAAGFFPSALTMGDVNGDGQADLAIADGRGNSLVMLLGNGDGTFQAPRAFAAGVQPYGVTLGDLNGDGKLDAVIANFLDNGVSVLFGNGDGTFQGQQTFFTGGGAKSIAVGDVNGDGRLDMAVANRGANSASVLLNVNRTNVTGPAYDIGAAASTATTLVATPLATTGGSSVMLTATVAPSPGALGTVAFLDNGVPIPGGGAVAVANGVAVFSTSALAVGSHSVTASYSGATGFAASVSNAQTVVVTSAATPPSVTGITLNGGLAAFAGPQHSRIIDVQIVFDQAVELDANAMTLALHLGNVRYGGVLQPAGMGAVPALVLNHSVDNKTWTVTFSGPNAEGNRPDGFASLVDGVYDFKIDAAKVHPLGVPAVNMATSRTTTFHRLFGDVGDPATPTGGTPAVDFEAIVNAGDNLAFRTSFNNAATYKAYLDANGDGLINSGDNLAFRTRFNKSLTWST